jgi:anti-sigma B factor antagonist
VASLVVDIVPTPAATLVTVFGEVDLATVARFRERLDLVADCDMVMEMSDVALLSAVGLRVLLDLQDRLAALGAGLVLAAPARPVRRVLTVTGLDARLPMAPTVEDALIVLGSVARKQRTMSAVEQCQLPAEPAREPAPVTRGVQRDAVLRAVAGAMADKPVGCSDDERSRNADQCPAFVVRDAAAVPPAVKSALMQEQTVILQVGAAAVRQASAELKARAAALRRQAGATRAGAQACRRRGGSSQPSVNTCDLISDAKQSADAGVQQERVGAGSVAVRPGRSVRAG